VNVCCVRSRAAGRPPKLARCSSPLQDGTTVQDVEAPIQAVYDHRLGSIRQTTQELAQKK